MHPINKFRIKIIKTFLYLFLAQSIILFPTVNFSTGEFLVKMIFWNSVWFLIYFLSCAVTFVFPKTFMKNDR